MRNFYVSRLYGLSKNGQKGLQKEKKYGTIRRIIHYFQMKNTSQQIGPETLLLSREIFKNRVMQVIMSSLLLLLTIGVQIYLFVIVNSFIKLRLLEALS